MPSCFVIMPIATPDHLIPAYGDDVYHFKHVLDHLFIPAIKLAGFTALPPIAKGAELIHAGIIKNLESSDLVLCDMSLLNPNVFFELGIRTALNKPVSMVKDEKTEQVPFDTTIINHHTYSSTLAPWMLDHEVQSLKAHIEASMTSHGKNNALWSYFSMSLKAQPAKETTGVEGKVDFLNIQLQGLRRGFDKLSMRLPPPTPKRRSECDILMDELYRMAGQYVRLGAKTYFEGSNIQMEFPEPIPDELAQSLMAHAALKGFNLDVIS